jgi:hypothetical protein
MSNSFKNLQNKLQKLKKELSTNEPERRVEALRYMGVLTRLVNESYNKESTSDYLFIKTLTDSVTEAKHFGGFTNEAKKRLRIIEDRYNYIHENQTPDIE